MLIESVLKRYQIESGEAIPNAQSKENRYPILISALFGGFMKKKMSVVISLVITAIVLFSYQNCGVEAPQSYFDQEQLSQLPYQATVDQVAYMSCAEQGNVVNDPGVFFTFRVGAYQEGSGLALSDTFMEYTRRSEPDDRAVLLMQEMNSKNYRLQFSVRKQSDLGTMYINSTSGTGIESIDYDFVFGDLGSSEMSASLVGLNTGEAMSYWSPGGITADAYMSGSMVFNASEALAADIRNFMTNTGILAVGFSTDNEPGVLLNRSAYFITGADNDGDGSNEDSDDMSVPANQAFGVGLKVTFRQPLPSNWGYTGVAHLNLPKRVLNSVQEYDLSKPTTIKSTWTCDAKYQLRIFYPGTEGTLCPDVAAPTSGTNLTDYQIVRNSLPASDWKINWSKKCVVPLRYALGSCYGINSTGSTPVTRTAVYDITQTCDPAVNSVCAHFVSICLRPTE